MKDDNVSSKKSVLLISYHFPPSAAVGGLRIAHFAKTFSRYGWKTSVLTVEDAYIEKVDRERLKDLSDIKIYRAGKTPSFFRESYLGLKRLLYRYVKKMDVTKEQMEDSYAPPEFDSSNREDIRRKVKRYILSFLALPDGDRDWILPAVVKGIRVIRREKVDLILTSCPPHSVQLVGLLLKMLTGVKWVVDYRDPWIIGRSDQRYPTTALTAAIERWLEKQVVRKADTVIFTTETLCELFKRSFGDGTSSKLMRVSNGFDPDFFARYRNMEKYGKYTITYTGAIYFDRTPEPIFKALSALAEEGRIDLGAINVKLIGQCRHLNGKPIASIVKSYGLEGSVEIIDTVPYSEAVEAVSRSQLALLIAYDQPLQIPAKVFDYMGTGTRILGLCKEGATADLIRSTGIGSVFHPSDIDGIKVFLEKGINGTVVSGAEMITPEIDKYDRRRIMKDLVNRLNRLG